MALVIGTNCGFVTVAPTTDPAGTQLTFDNLAGACKFTSPAGAATITEMGFYVDGATEEANFEMAVYAADGAVVPGEAGTRLHHSATNAKGTTAGWKTVTGLSWAISGSTDYWLAVQLDNTATATPIDTATSGGAGYDTLFVSALPNPFGGGALADADGILAVYAVYTVAGSTSGRLVNNRALKRLTGPRLAG